MLQSSCSVQPFSYRSNPGLPCMSISNARLLPLIKYIPAAPPFWIWAEKTPQTSFKICGVGVCEKGCCLAVTSLLSLGYSIFELTCLLSALKSVDFTGLLLVFLCQRSLVECFFQKIKWFRRIATRYDKSDASFLTFVYLASIAILLL